MFYTENCGAERENSKMRENVIVFNRKNGRTEISKMHRCMMQFMPKLKMTHKKHGQIEKEKHESIERGRAGERLR